MSEYYMTHTGKELDDAINKVKSGYILPSETINIIENVSNKDITNGKILNVNVPVPSGYIKTSDTKNYTTRFATGTFSVASDTLISSVSITVGFKPKIFVLRILSGMQITSTRQYIDTAWMVTDNNYNHLIVKPDGSTDARTAGVTGMYYQSNSTRSNQSNSANNCFQVTDTGVKGNGSTSSSFYFMANKTFYWFAWG